MEKRIVEFSYKFNGEEIKDSCETNGSNLGAVVGSIYDHITTKHDMPEMACKANQPFKLLGVSELRIKDGEDWVDYHG